MKLERSENVKIINGYLKDNCRFQLDSIAEDSIYRDITATGRTYLYKNHAFEYDLNGDGKISTAYIQVIINEMKK